MFHESYYRVPYADTDQMGVVYYANYLEYFERSRTEMLRDCGFSYSELEKCGFFLPVTEANCRYLASAHYDELLTFRSSVTEIKGVRLKIASEVLLQDKLLVKGTVTVCCMNYERKLVRPPEDFVAACRKYFVSE